MSTRTLSGLLRARAGERGEDLALRFKGDEGWSSWSHARLWEGACRVAAGLAGAGLRPGDHALMLVPEVEAAVVGLFGAWALGVVPIQVGLPFRLTDVGAFLAQLRLTAQRLDARAIIVSRALAAFATEPTDVPLLVAEDLLAAEPDGAPDPDAAPGPALIQLTSGSTGHPRGVVLSHERLMLHMASMSQALPSHRDSVAVSWLPLHHDMGLIGGLLFPFYNGFPGHLLSPMDFRSRPLSWLAAMSELRATICAAPPSAYALVVRLARKARDAGLDLRAWECAMIGAEPISPALLRSFVDAFAPVGFRAEAFFPVYGLAEATVAVTFPRLLAPTRVDSIDRVALERTGAAVPCPPSTSALELVSVGRPIPGTELELVDEDGAMLPERRVGEILVRATTLMQGYYRDPKATSEAMREGWLRTGDLGYLADGELFITGRKKELIIKGGHNLIPSVIEELAGTVEGVRSGCVVAVGVRAEDVQTERVYVVAETKVEPAERPALAERIRETLQQRAVVVDQILLVEPGTLPKTTSGKLRRRAVAETLAAGRPLEAL
jgi:acyl-CoA synthetase (AMP-forming)/AMP-acid ligase II